MCECWWFVCVHHSMNVANLKIRSAQLVPYASLLKFGVGFWKNLESFFKGGKAIPLQGETGTWLDEETCEIDFGKMMFSANPQISSTWVVISALLYIIFVGLARWCVRLCFFCHWLTHEFVYIFLFTFSIFFWKYLKEKHTATSAINWCRCCGCVNFSEWKCPIHTTV